jgi:uncharacterized repeat protein (TIGR01451 family)
VADVKVLININHTFDADLDIFLISPLGTRVELSTDNGSSGDNYVNTIFDDAAATSITAGTAPFTGSYRPETPLSAVDGQSISGDWKLEVTDDLGGDTGTLLNWSLIIQTPKCADAPFLALSKTASASTIQPGQQLTYTLETRSTGELASTGVVLSDTLPANVTYVSSSDGGVFSSGVVTWTVGTIPFGTSVTRTLTVQVNAGVSNGTILSNTFTALSTELPAQNSNTAATTVVAFPSIVVGSAVVTSDQSANQIVTKTLTISNVGTAPLNWNITEQALARLTQSELWAPIQVSGSAKSDRRPSVNPNYSLSVYNNRPILNTPLALINDGSFENLSSAWTEVDNTGCTPWIGDWSSIVGITAYDGTQYFWAGGYCGAPNSNSAAQSLLVPAGSPVLSFYYQAKRTDPDDTTNGVAYVKVNGTMVWSLSMVQANNTTGWVKVTVDLSAYGGQTVSLAFGADNVGTGVGNVFFDYVEWNSPACSANALPWVTAVPVSGTTAPNGSSNIGIVFDSIGLSSGVYTGTLCLNTNDTVKPQVLLPLTMTVTATCVPVSGVDFTYTPTAPKVGKIVTFNGTALTGTMPITYSWNYGDGSAVGSGSPITHVFPITNTAHSYTVTLTTANACTAPTPTQKAVLVAPYQVYLPLVRK